VFHVQESTIVSPSNDDDDQSTVKYGSCEEDSDVEVVTTGNNTVQGSEMESEELQSDEEPCYL